MTGRTQEQSGQIPEQEGERRGELAERIAGEIALSEDPGATMQKWRTEFEVAQSDLAAALDVSPSVVSDYEGGRRANPGIGVVRRTVETLLDIDERRGGEHIRRYARVLSAGFDREAVRDLREYPSTVALDRYYDVIGATELVEGDRETIAGHTVIDSIAAIQQLSGEEFYDLYGRSTNRALVFTGVTRGESPLVALRVVTQTPHAVVLHGIDEDALWEHAPALARRDGISLALCETELDEMLDRHHQLP
jgi:putative transcriptional regulator